MKIGPVAAAFSIVVALCVATPNPAKADSSVPTGPDENSDVTTPSAAPADTRPSTSPTQSGGVTTMAVVVGPVTEDYRYDEQKTEGRANQICSGRLLQGSEWAFWEIVERFGGQAGTMYSCRERWDAANDPDCNGTVSNPSSTFYSTCWSNHAAGRAIDIMVGGSASSGYNRTRGLAIVNWLLTNDPTYGNLNVRARRLGIQQILFDDRCWNSDGDRGISTWNAMRECGIGHHDHVHIDLTIDGANGAVSYWGRTPRPLQPKPDTLALFDFSTAWREAVSWYNLRETDEEGVAIPAGYDRSFPGDWDSDGVESEVLLWNEANGAYIIQKWNDGDSLNARMGQFNRHYEDIVVGDFDGDGHTDDVILWDQDAGLWVGASFYRYDLTYRISNRLSTTYDDWTAGDFDGDGVVDDTFIWDHDSGFWKVYSWHGLRPNYRNQGTWPTAWDALIVGDWSGGGDMDEAILWNRDTGQWLLQKWSGYGYRMVNSGGMFRSIIDIMVPGDYDSDGRVDDLYMYDTATGNWWIYSFHRYGLSLRRSGSWASGFDDVAVGALSQ